MYENQSIEHYLGVAKKQFMLFLDVDGANESAEPHFYEFAAHTTIVQESAMTIRTLFLLVFIGFLPRIFNFFLYLGCVPQTEEHTLMKMMMTDEGIPWKKPVEVFGYNDAVNILGGSFFEAETTCIEEHNMGQERLETNDNKLEH